MLQAPRYVSMIISHIVPVTDIKRSCSQLPFAAFLFVMLFGSAGSAQTDTPRVLFLSHFAGSTVTQHAIEAGMEEVLRDGFVNVTFEFLDFGLLEKVDERPVPWEDVLRIKHAETQFDVIVGYGARASEVAEDIRDSLGGPPILHVHSNSITDSLAQGDAGLSFVFDVEGNVSPILELADPERVILVAEMRNEADRGRLEKIRSAYDAHGFAGEIDVWSGRPMDVVLDDAANADEGTVIHYLAMFTDTAGRAIEPNRAAARLTEISDVPVFSLEATDIAPRTEGPSGTVGGYVIDPSKMGRETALAILALADGKPVADRVSAMGTIYDWKALERWNLPVSAVPAGARILNRPPSLWAVAKPEIIITAIAFVLLSGALIAAVLLARQRDRARTEAAETARRLSAAQAAARLGVFRRDFRAGKIDCDRQFRELFGLPQEGEVTIDQLRSKIDPRDRDMAIADVAELSRSDSAGKSFQTEYRVMPDDGEHVRWIHLQGRMEFDDRGPAFFTGAVYDVTDRREAEEMREVLLHEMAHRAKNSIAVVHGIASQTFRNSSNLEQSVAAFRQRLQALASAHELLARSEGDATSMEEVAENALFDIAGAEGQVRLNGPRTILPAKTAQGVTMALHELVTNAIKHGALSVEGGSVDLHWRIARNNGANAIEIEWSEKGGPPAEKPEKENFGLTLLKRILPHDHDGEADLSFEKEGFRYTLLLTFPNEQEGDTPT